LTETAITDVTVQLESYKTTVATVPASVVIRAGSRCASYSIKIVGALDTFIHAKLYGFWLSQQLSVYP
jgi:hypothetical protein